MKMGKSGEREFIYVHNKEKFLQGKGKKVVIVPLVPVSFATESHSEQLPMDPSRGGLW